MEGKKTIIMEGGRKKCRQYQESQNTTQTETQSNLITRRTPTQLQERNHAGHTQADDQEQQNIKKNGRNTRKRFKHKIETKNSLLSLVPMLPRMLPSSSHPVTTTTTALQNQSSVPMQRDHALR